GGRARSTKFVSRTRARSRRRRRNLLGRNAQQRRAAAHKAVVRREFVRCLNVLWAIGPSCLFGGGLALPPVIPVVLALVRLSSTSERLRPARTRAADRTTDHSGRRRLSLSRYGFASNAWSSSEVRDGISRSTLKINSRNHESC